MGNVTQSRYLYTPTGSQHYYYWKGVQVPVTHPEPVGQPIQTGYQETTSFRSKSGVDQSTPELQQTSGSHAALMKELRDSGENFRHWHGSDTGHEFRTLKQQRWQTSSSVSLKSELFGTGTMTYEGNLTVGGLSNPPTFEPYPDSDAVLDGSRLIRRSIPTAPEAGIAAFLGELREQLPTLVGTLLWREGVSLSSVAGEHLNVEFGIKPFLSDLTKICLSVKRMHTLIRQFARDSEKITRRRRSLDHSTSSVELPASYQVPGIGLYPWGDGSSSSNYPAGYFLSDLGVVRTIDTVSRDVWFSGAFQYYLNQDDSFLGKMERYEQLANRLLGTRLDANVIWELTPWSWLIDWFSDSGSFVANLMSLTSDSLVMRYGYLMATTTATRERTQIVTDNYGSRLMLRDYNEIVEKTRTQASPYGFGIDVSWENLSPRRWSILAAIGISNGRSPQ